MKIISVTNNKGGAGKTTFAELLALSLSTQGHKVLCIDCDPQGSLTDALRIDNGLGFDLEDLSALKAMPESDIIFPEGTINSLILGKNENYFEYTKYHNIKLVSSDFSFDKMYTNADPFSFTRILKNLKERFEAFDYVIFDAPPTLQGITQAAIMASDKIFVPCEISEKSIRATIHTFTRLEELQKKGEAVFVIDKSNKTKYAENLLEAFLILLCKKSAFVKGHKITKNTEIQKLTAGRLKLTDSKIEKYLKPVLEILGA